MSSPATRALIAAVVAMFAACAVCDHAAAVDLPSKAPSISAPTVSLPPWAGPYIGVSAGWGSGEKDWRLPAALRVTHDVSGLLLGGQIGYAVQLDAWVLGAEAAWNWADVDGNSACPNPIFACGSKVKWLGAITGRGGYAWGPMLVYVKGGGALVSNRYTVTLAGVEFVNGSETRSGWTGGAGLEYAFAANWSVRVEYNFYDFGTERLRLSDGTPVRVDQDMQTVTLGLNYRFGF